MVFVVRKKKLQRALAFRFRGVAAQSAADQLRRAVADVAGDGVFVKLLAAHFRQHGVDGSDQVQLGIDERAVQVENQRAHGRKIRSNHKKIIVIWPRFFGSHPGMKLQRKFDFAAFSEFRRIRVK